MNERTPKRKSRAEGAATTQSGRAGASLPRSPLETGRARFPSIRLEQFTFGGVPCGDSIDGARLSL